MTEQQQEEQEQLAKRFESSRAHLHSVAYRMLGSHAEAEDAVQEAWLRLQRSDSNCIDNLGGWLTTAVARVCLDQLRTRSLRTEDPLGEESSLIWDDRHRDAEQETLLADSVGLALLVVLQKLGPSERVAFVLHDMFDIPFEDIASIVGKPPAAARQLASRARRRIRGGTEDVEPDLARQREVIEAFLAASRQGDLKALIRVLDASVVFRADASAARMGSAREIRGRDPVAQMFVGRASAARAAIVDGQIGIVVAPENKPMLVIHVRMTDGRITALDAVADPETLAAVDLSEAIR